VDLFAIFERRSSTVPHDDAVAGERRAPPEDVGGVDGFHEFLKAATRPRHREHNEVLTWYGGPFDPEDLGQAEIEAKVGKLARRRQFRLSDDASAARVRARPPTPQSSPSSTRRVLP
jgi:Plasmid pRiA4b ORF-3-like protein